MNHSADKSTLRTEMLAKRGTIAHDEAEMCAELLAENLSQLSCSKGSIIAGYAPARGEIDIMPSLKMLFAAGYPIALPVTQRHEKNMHFHLWKPEDHLRKGAHGIYEPEAKSPPVTPDVLLVPLVAFDSHGHRLGYGGGYYDRYLAAQKKLAQAIGIAYSMQQQETLPVEPHDAKLGAVVTEQGWIRFS